MKENNPFAAVSSEENAKGEFQSMKNSFSEYMSLYSKYKAAIREITTKLKNLDEDFELLHQHDPIHTIQSRVKSPESVMTKMERKNLDFTLENIENNIKDVAGVRVICHYIEDIYTVAELIKDQDDIEVVRIRDYIKNPKPNGYRSLHLVVEVPVFFVNRKENIAVEIQLRTIAMDFWASLEHQLKYKAVDEIPRFIVDELRECASTISDTDVRMQRIHDFLESIENV